MKCKVELPGRTCFDFSKKLNALRPSLCPGITTVFISRPFLYGTGSNIKNAYLHCSILFWP